MQQLLNIVPDLTHITLLSFACFVVAMLLTPVYTYIAYRYQFWKVQRTESTDGKPLTVFNRLHAAKFRRNIPTMAGLIFVIVIAAVTLVANLDRQQTWLPLAALRGGSAVGLPAALITLPGVGGG